MLSRNPQIDGRDLSENNMPSNIFKISREKNERIIREETKKVVREIILEGIGSTSKLEMQELLGVFLKKQGWPKDINKLSILFPILDKAGLDNVTQAYLDASESDPELASQILKDLREVLINTKRAYNL